MTIAYRHEQLNADGGGKLHVTANTEDDTVEIVTVIGGVNRQDWRKIAEAVKVFTEAGEYTIASYSEKYPWYCCDTYLPDQFVEVYKRAYEVFAGPVDQLPEVNLLPYYPGACCYTHIAEEVQTTEYATITVSGYIQSQPWNGLDAATYADKKFSRCVLEKFGTVPSTPEFIQRGNGQYSRNPDYGTGKRKPVSPCPRAWVVRALFDYWLENVANDSQKDLIAKVVPADRHVIEDAYEKVWYDSTFYVLDPDGFDWDGKGTKVGNYRFSDLTKLVTTPKEG